MRILIVCIISTIILTFWGISFFKERTHINNVFEKDRAGISYLEIKKIKLKGIVSEESVYSKKIKGIVMFKEFGRPNLTNTNTVIGAHSGNGSNSFFTNLDKIELGEKVNYFYKGKKYEYKVIKKFFVDESNTKILNNIKEKTTLTIFTCNEVDNNYRLILLLEPFDFT